MIYGIRSDTQDLGRESTRADVEAYLALYPLANARVLGRIVSAPLPHSYFSKLQVALSRAVVYGYRIVSVLGELDSPEMVAEAADLLLRAEEVRWTMCVGIIEGWIHLSLRTNDRDGNAGKIARNLGGRRGFGGGHQALAAAQIPIPANGGGTKEVDAMVRGLIRRFLKATGGVGEAGTPLCRK
jgi:nanoRNase/pAp phosphatase (c-di-AMP/oligoRNAs hydrolase)